MCLIKICWYCKHSVIIFRSLSEKRKTFLRSHHSRYSKIDNHPKNWSLDAELEVPQTSARSSSHQKKQTKNIQGDPQRLMWKGWRRESLSTPLSPRSTALESLNNKSDSPPEVVLTVVQLWLDVRADDNRLTSAADLQPVPTVSRGCETALEQRLLGSVTYQSLPVKVKTECSHSVTVELQEKVYEPFWIPWIST